MQVTKQCEMSNCEQCIVREFSALKTLTKDELIEKLLANYILQTKNEILSKTEKPIKKQKRMN